ncbi:hypothetical protein Nepgr_021943 [Nepenthes gracilis]|uniref:WRC domain-containing protein n=1 Tax=Nepenthes gracilis TaxID=150966 RepID=A0AAD3T0W8_NEPGR|nr:hypothetical protein Nepgr_021943 [Nepenthes gracilis]
MRIRKRQVPLPFSLLSPVSLSDPHLFIRLPVVQPASHPNANGISTHSQPSDYPTNTRSRDRDPRHMIGSESDSGVYPQANRPQKMELKGRLDFEGEDVEDEWREKEENTNDINKGRSILGAVANNEFPPPSFSASNAVRRWCHGDKTVPLKKRIRRENPVIICSVEIEEKTTTLSRMRCNISEKFLRCSDEGEDQEEKEDEKERRYTMHGGNSCRNNRNNSTSTGPTKKSKRGNTIMEGSRCSRMNGRGWRCCQPTLVGYSLCEHHLGKGRLRSMTSVHRCTSPSKISEQQLSVASCSLSSTGKRDGKAASAGGGGAQGEEDDHDDPDVDNVKKKKQQPPPLMMSSKKRGKLGMVKARSLSSLLDQTNKAVAVDNNGVNI